MLKKFYYKQNKHRSTLKKRVWHYQKWYKNYTKKLEMQSVTFVVSLCKLYAVGLILCLQIADVHGIEVNDVLTW